MKHNLKTELIALKKQMAKHQLAPAGRIIANNQPHTYQARIDGELKEAVYTATAYPLEEDPNGPVLICSYGLTNDKKHHHHYSSSPPNPNGRSEFVKI